MVLKMDQRCAYAAKPFVPDLISLPWIGLSSKAPDRLWFRREDKNRVESHKRAAFFLRILVSESAGEPAFHCASRLIPFGFSFAFSISSAGFA